MARLLSLGFELNSNSNFQEFDSTTGSPTIQTTTVRSGVYAGQITGLTTLTQKGWRVAWTGAQANGPFFARYYFRYATAPASDSTVFSIVDQAGNDTSPNVSIVFTSSATLVLNQQTAGNIGSASAALTANTWYRIEIKVDKSLAAASQTIEARIDGVAFATASNLTYGTGFMGLNFGGNYKGEANAAGNWYFDDIAVNDATGSFQNTWPGDGKIIELRPNAAGDVNTFAVGAGGTAGTANNYTRSAETSPDGNTTYNVGSLLNSEDLFNVVNSGIGSTDTVNVVHVNGQLTDDTLADATTALQFEIEKTAGGTILQSAAIIPNSTTYGLPTNASPRTYPITAYQDPDGAAWTQTTLDSMQIGYKETSLGVNNIRVSQVYAMVDYTPAVAVTAATQLLTSMGVG